MGSETAPALGMSRTDLRLPLPYAAPEGETETLVANLFAEVFKLDRVGVNDDFFDLGGDSLIAEIFTMRVRELTGHEFKVSALVEHGSPRQIAALLPQAGEVRVAPRAAAPARPPIFVVHGRQGLTFPRPEFFRALAEGQKLHIFELPGLHGGHCYTRIEDIAALYVAQLTEAHPQGPVLLAAFCAGGLIALEMAAQLAAKGRPVCHLVLLDPPIRKGSLGIGRIEDRDRWTLFERVKSRVEMALPAFLARPFLEVRYRRFLARTSAADPKWSKFPLSPKARAKLFMAFVYYRPQRYDGPVTVLSSTARPRAYNAGFNLQNLLPQVRVEPVTKIHRHITGAEAARAMQAVFDAALEAEGKAEAKALSRA
ncbi:MAG: alpha/beta fold hydrolase [Methyloceanibacter sp.]